MIIDVKPVRCGKNPTFWNGSDLLIVNTTGSNAKYGREFSVDSCNTAMTDTDILFREASVF
jgi:hypothetical protein